MMMKMPIKTILSQITKHIVISELDMQNLTKL